MTNFKNTLAKGALGTIAAGAMALASASPAMADDNRYRDRGVDAGDVIAGAVIIGGIAALAGAFGKDDDRYRDRRYRDRRGDYRYNRGYMSGQHAVERCVRAAERQARRFGGFRYADVTQIRDVDRTRYGYRVDGRIEVEGGHGYRDRHRGYRDRGYDRGRFKCYVDGRGRPQVEFRGIRGLR